MITPPPDPNASQAQPDAPAIQEARGARISSLLSAMRPKQWVKNVLVLIVPFVGEQILDWHIAARAGVMVVAFVLASSATYIFNDLLNRDEDRQHPRKAQRPVASGAVSRRTAASASAVLAAGGCSLAASVGLQSFVVLGAYLLMQLAYTLALRQVAVIELFCVACGFLLRVVGGSTSTSIPVSDWLLVCALAGALLVAAGKRLSEKQRTTMGSSVTVRRVVSTYTASFLRLAVGVTAALLCTAYSLWATSEPGLARRASIGPFLAAVLLYTFAADKGEAEAPENQLLADRTLVVVGGLWVALVAWDVYLGG